MRLQRGTFTDTANLFQGAGESRRITRELDGRCVREKFALPTYRGLHQASEQNPDPADDDQGQPQEEERPRILSAGANENATDDGETKDAEDETHQAQVEFHVAVEQVAELVRDHALQFVAVKHGHGSTRDADGGVTRGMTGSERVDAGFA